MNKRILITLMAFTIVVDIASKPKISKTRESEIPLVPQDVLDEIYNSKTAYSPKSQKPIADFAETFEKAEPVKAVDKKNEKKSANVIADKVEQDSLPGANKFLINKIIMRVNGVNILKSDIEQPRISKEGKPYTEDELLMEELIFQQAAEKHMLPTNVDIERQIVAFKIQNKLENITDKEFESELKSAGFTFDGYKNQLGRMLSVENVRHSEFSDKVFVTSQEVEAYYKNHPEYSKERYKLKIATVSDEQAALGLNGLDLKALDWETLDWVDREEIGKEFEFIFSMKKGEIAEPKKVEGKFQIVQIDDKGERALKTLDERYGEIERLLQQEKKGKALEQFESDLKTKAIIVRL